MGGKAGGGAATGARRRATPRKKAPAPRRKGNSRKRKRTELPGGRYRGGEFLLSGLALAAITLAVLGYLAGSVTPLLLLGALAGTVAAGVLLVVGLERARTTVSGAGRHALNLLVLVSTATLLWWMPPTLALEAFREVLAGERMTQVRVLRHQVYAAYRRMDLDGQSMILERARVFEPTVHEAAAAFGEDPEILMGVAATESSFHPRPSRDGGRGLFQITAVPEAARAAAREKLGSSRLDPVNQRHNAFLAAATLSAYREQMAGDLFLSLLAYNIGPHNGGLAFVMEKYGASNFAQAQPYLKELPRDYPIRVLSAALAYRVWREFGELPRFEEGARAAEIQALGVPGLDAAEPGWWRLPGQD